MRICDGCNKTMRTKHIVMIKGKFLCHQCRMKNESNKIMQSACEIGRPIFNEINATNKIYKVHTHYKKGGYKTSIIFVPTILEGKFVKLEIVKI